MDPVEALVRRGGAGRRGELVGLGCSRYAVEAAIRQGRLEAVGRGGLVLPGAAPALVAAARLSARVGCLSAVALAGVPVLVEPSVPHLLAHRQRAELGVQWHRRVGSDLVQDLAGAVLEVCRCRPRVEALAVVDAALGRGLVREAELRAARLGREPENVQWVLDHADPEAGSPLESALRGLLLTAGVRGVQSQAQLSGVGRVDLLVDGWLVLEADGFEFHRGRADYRTDRRRSGAATVRGYITLRFSYEDVLGHPTACVDAVRTTLDRHRRGAFATAI